ncbi:MAG TPA: glycerate kinase [Candidatus Binatia bacterium]|jgi:hydroxypyruvate reductase
MTLLMQLRADAREIFLAGLKAADPLDAINKTVQLQNDHLHVANRSYALLRIRNIFITGCGKAAARMALAIEDLLGDRVTGGIVVVKYGHDLPLDRVKVVEAGHPVPDDAGLDGARQIVELVRAAGENDLVVFLISGGGSALFPGPADGLTLADKQRTTQTLLQSGATIQEVNAVRKHISTLKGGRFAKLVAPAHLVSLILSDVVDDSLEAIASGPTVADSTTYSDCLEIIRRYDLKGKIPNSVLQLLQRGVKGAVDETPKPADAVFQKVQNVVVGSNQTALKAAERHAEVLGYHTRMLSSSIEGESRSIAETHSALVKEIALTDKPVRRPACVISGGETTVTVRGDGLGGRNQEFALAAAIQIDGLDGAVVLSAGTDGTDGPTDAAGGIVDGSTIQRGRSKGFDAMAFLTRNDSYHFLKATDDLLITGPTFTNVMDLQVMLVA